MNLDDFKNQFCTYGLASNLFEYRDIDEIKSKLDNIKKIVVNNKIEGIASIDYNKGIIIIKEKEIFKRSNWYLFEIIFHEMVKFISDIHNELYFNKEKSGKNVSSKLQELMKKEGYHTFDFEEFNSIEDGLSLLDEVVLEYATYKLIEEKFGENIYSTKFMNASNLSFDKKEKGNVFAEYYIFAEKFSYTLSKGQNIDTFCTNALKEGFLDRIISTYKEEHRLDDLYKTLSYLGRIYNKDENNLSIDAINDIMQNLIILFNKNSKKSASIY